MESRNLILRRMTYDDIHDLFEMRSDPRMHEFTDSYPDEDTTETKAYIDAMNKGIDENKWIIWAIEHKESRKVIGTISIWNINEDKTRGELGFGIIPDYQGQGLMKESILAVIDYGFNVMKLKELDAYSEEKNIKSINLLKSLNFKEVDRVVDKGNYEDRDYNMIVYRTCSQ